MHALTSILLPTDFSDNSKEAATWAIEMAQRFDAAIDVVYVDQPLAVALPEGYVMPSADALAERQGRLSDSLAEIEQMIGRAAPGIKVRSHTREGAPFAEIVQAARDLGSRMIIMGTHGRTGISHALLGSVAEKVVRKAPCPVLTVRGSEHRFSHP